MPDEIVTQETKETPVKTDLTQVIEDAVTKVATNVGKEIQEEEKTKEVEEKKTDSDKKDAEKQEETSEADLNAEQLTFAKTLYKALNNQDPNVQRETLNILAKSAGLTLSEVTTKAEAVEAKDALLDLLKTHLGEYDFLADKLAPVLKTAIKSIVDENTKDIRDEQKRVSENTIRNQISTSIDTAFAKYSNALEVKDLVLSKMDQFKMGPKMTYIDYFNSLIVLAANEKGLNLKLTNSKASEEVDDKIKRNRQDAHSRLASDRAAEIKEVVRNPRERRKLDLVINDAMEEVSKQINTR